MRSSAIERPRQGPDVVRVAMLIAAGVLWLGVTVAQAARHDTELVSRADDAPEPDGEYVSLEASLSGDARIVAFYSEATAFAGGDVVVRDRRSRRSTVMSVASGPTRAAHAAGCARPSVSADGRHVAFSCLTSPAPGGPFATSGAVFARHRAGRRTALISRATGQRGTIATGDSDFPASSADGRYVAFVSTATNLSPEDPDPAPDVYVRDTRRGVTILVSRATGLGGAKGDGSAGAPAISADGRYVAFSSWARNLSDDDGDTDTDVFVRDLRRHATTLVSRRTGRRGDAGNGSSTRTQISSDGRFVVFTSRATNLSVRDRNERADVFVRDLRRHRTVLVSRATGRPGLRTNRGSGNARSAISGNGRYVAFTSAATNLDRADPVSDTDVYLRDLWTHTTRLVSRRSGAHGRKARYGSTGPAISADGRYVAFESNADDLDRADRDNGLDVYVRRVR